MNTEANNSEPREPEPQEQKSESIYKRVLRQTGGLMDFFELRHQYTVGDEKKDATPDDLENFTLGLIDGKPYASNGEYNLPYNPDFFYDRHVDVLQRCGFPTADDEVGQTLVSRLVSLAVFRDLDSWITDPERKKQQVALHDEFIEKLEAEANQHRQELLEQQQQKEAADRNARRLLDF